MSNAFNTGEFQIATQQFSKLELVHLSMLVNIAVIDAARTEQALELKDLIPLQTKIARILRSL